jgi:hypothetical protein
MAKAEATKNVAGAARASHAARLIRHAKALARVSQKRRGLAAEITGQKGDGDAGLLASAGKTVRRGGR